MADHRSDMPGRGGRFLVPGLAVAAGVVLACVPARAQDFTMKFATQTLNDMQHEYIKVYKTELEKATNNRIKVEVYPASQLGGAPRQTEGLRLGTIEAAIAPVELFVGADQRFQVPALAGLYKDREHLKRVVDVPAFRQAIFEVANARGMVGLSAAAYDMQSFVFKAPVAKVAEAMVPHLKGRAVTLRRFPEGVDDLCRFGRGQDPFAGHEIQAGDDGRRHEPGGSAR